MPTDRCVKNIPSLSSIEIPIGLYRKLPKFYLPSRWLVTKCSRRCERDFAEWEIHKGSWKDMKSLTLNGGRSVWFLYFINSELGIVDCFQFHIPLFPLSSNILFVGSLLDWVNITMCVSHLLPWVLSGQSLYEIMQRFFLLLLSGQSLYKIILRFFFTLLHQANPSDYTDFFLSKSGLLRFLQHLLGMSQSPLIPWEVLCSIFSKTINIFKIS